MTRVALYARYSSDSQREASIDDQLRQCRERASREGWAVVDSYSDRAISGASLTRPGIQELLVDAQAGHFDVVLSEALDRLSRDQEDVAAVFKRLRFANVSIFTLSEGQISELHVGLKGTMNALFLKDLALKTHRGIRGRIEAGKLAGGNPYGYRVVRRFDERGEAIRGERAIIDEQANVIRRIFREYVAGKGPLSIAADLNRDGVPGPTGKRWCDSTIRGNPTVGSGLLNRELYIGIVRWNRQRMIKNPITGRRVSRVNPEGDWIRVDAPELRIVPQDLWDAAKARQAELAVLYRDDIENSRAAIRRMTAINAGLNATHRPRTLLSGLLVCGCCGASYVRRGQDRYVCSNHLLKNGCGNKRNIGRRALEVRVLDGLKDRMMTPEVAAEAMRAYAEETERLNRDRRLNASASRRELSDIERASKEIVDVIEKGGWHRALSDRLAELEKRHDELIAQLGEIPADSLQVHSNTIEIYRGKVGRLTEALADPDDALEATTALRGIIDRIVVTPGDSPKDVKIMLHGDLGTVLAWTTRSGEGGRGTANATSTSSLPSSVNAGTFRRGRRRPRCCPPARRTGSSRRRRS
jgi:DNA invertase Pin-like site-specific DNA recombinase